MYCKDINILVQSSNNKIAFTLKSLDIKSNFDLLFETDAKQFSGDGRIDIIIVDIDTTEFVPTDSKTLLVLATKCSSVPTELLKVADELWLNATDDSLLAFYFDKLLKRIEMERSAFMDSNYLGTLIDNIPDLIWFKNIDGIHLKVNDAFCKAVGKAKGDVEGRNHYYIWDIPKEIYERSDYVCLNTDDVVIETLKPQSFDEKVFAKTGLRQFITYKAPIFDENNKLAGTMGCAHDVTELKNISTELGTILDSLPFAILVEDNQGIAVNANEKFMEIFNPDNKSLLGKAYSIEKYLGSSSYKIDKNRQEVAITIKGQEQIFSKIIEPLHDFFQNPLGSLHIYQDITLERSIQSKMKELAYTDQLTGLYQRRYLYEWSDGVAYENLSLLYIDLDNFKCVNDNYGHMAGDKTLTTFAKLLRSSFPDNLVARIGGDEFVVIIEEKCTQEELGAMAQALIDEVCAVFHKDDSTKMLSASVGIACASQENYSFDALLKRADIALYESKRIGKNCYVLHQ